MWFLADSWQRHPLKPLQHCGCSDISDETHHFEYAAWTCDDQRLVCALIRPREDRSTLIVFDTDRMTIAGTLDNTLHEYSVTCVVASPVDPRIVATTARDARVVLWDTVTLTPARVFVVGNTINSTTARYFDCLDMKFSPCGTMLAVTDIGGCWAMFATQAATRECAAAEQFFHSDFESLAV